MIFWIVCIALVISLIILSVCIKTDFSDLLEFASVIVAVISTVVVIFMLICIVISHVGIDGQIEANQQRYDSLVYQAKNHLFDDIHVSKKQLTDQITEWNADLAKNKKFQRDPWIGIFYPDIYDEFEFIPIELLGGDK